MTIRQRLAALLSLVLGGVAVGVAIGQTGSSQAEVDAAIIEAAYALKDMGLPVEEIPALVAGATGVDVAVVQPLVDRATLAKGRDPLALRSATLTMLVPVADLDAADEAFASAACAPLELASDLHAACVAWHTLPLGAYACGGTHMSIAVNVTPGHAARAREAMTSTLFDRTTCSDPNMSGPP